MPHPSVVPAPVELFHEKLGPRVPLMSNSPSQWWAASGMILRAEVGSTAYGTNTPESDTDEMGVAIEGPVTVIGMRKFEVYRFRTAEPTGPLPEGTSAPSRPGDLDLTVHSLRRFASLAGGGNPSILGLLYVPDSAVNFINDYGRELRENAARFVSKRVYGRFSGYLHQEKLRMAKNKTPMKSGMHALRLGMQGVELLERGRLTIPPPPAQLRVLQKARAGEWTLEQLALKIAGYEGRLETALANTSLPEEPDWNWINTWLIDAHMRFWRK